MNKVKLFFRVIVTASLFYYIFFHLLDIDVFIKIIRNADLTFIFIASLFMILSVFIVSLRWQKILEIKGSAIKYKDILKIYFMGYFFNNFLPSSIGGDIIRVFQISKKAKLKKSDLFSSVVIERIIGFTALVLIASIGAFFLKIENNYTIAFIAIFVLIGAIASFFIIINETSNKLFANLVNKLLPAKIASFFEHYIISFRDYSAQKSNLVIALLYSILFRFIEGLFVWFVIKSLGIDLSFMYTLVLNAIVSTLKFIPVSLNGLGLSEMSWIALTKSSAIAPEQATTLSLLVYFVSIMVSLIGGYFYSVKKDVVMAVNLEKNDK